MRERAEECDRSYKQRDLKGGRGGGAKAAEDKVAESREEGGVEWFSWRSLENDWMASSGCGATFRREKS